MSAGLDLVSQMTPQTADQGLSKAPSTLSERFTTALNSAGFAPDDYWNAHSAQWDRAQKISDDYFAITNERLRNPFDVTVTGEERRKYPEMGKHAILQQRLVDMREKTRLMRDQVGDRGEVDPDFLNVDRINTAIGQTGEAMRHANEALVGTGYGAAAFAGEIVGSSVAPHNIAANLIPVSRLPMATAQGIGRTFLGNVGREALLQAGVGAGSSAVGEAAGYGTRAQFGTAPTAGEIGQNILGGAVGGALFGGTLRGTHLALGRLIHGPQVEVRPGEYGPAIEVPQTVKDAQVVMQTGDLYGQSNKLGIPEPEHDRAFLAAAPDVVAGRGAVVDMELPAGTAAAARTSHPALMAQHDALTTAIDDIRARLSPTDETIAHLRGQVDEINARIREGGPQTQEQAARLGGVARAREIELQEALARQAALARGEAVETPYTASLRQQLLTAQEDLRALSPQMREALGPDIMTRLAEEKALPAQAAQAAAEAGAQALPAVPEGMVRMFHGGESATAGGPRDVAATFDYARNFGEGNKPVWYVDVPVDSPWLRQVDVTGTNMPRSFMNSVAPEEVMAGAKLVPGTERGPAAARGPQHRPDFDEWQKTNKLTGENGQPLMAYHGTTRSFETFDPAMQGKGAGLGKGQEGFFFGGTPEMANEFAGKLGEGYVQGGQVRPAYLRMENPKIIYDTGEGIRDVNFGKEIAAAKAEGHDGVVIRNTVEGGDVKGDAYVVFDAENIKNFDERHAVPELDPVLQRLVDEVRNPPVEEGRPDFAAAATPTKPEDVVPKTAAVHNEEAQAVIAEAQALVERPDREVPRELRKALADATDDEAEAATAVACLVSGGAL